MLAKLKWIGLALSTFGMSILFAMLQKQKADQADEHEQIAEATVKAVTKSSEAIIDGNRRQKGIKNEKIDTDNRDILS